MMVGSMGASALPSFQQVNTDMTAGNVTDVAQTDETQQAEAGSALTGGMEASSEPQITDGGVLSDGANAALLGLFNEAGSTEGASEGSDLLQAKLAGEMFNTMQALQGGGVLSSGGDGSEGGALIGGGGGPPSGGGVPPSGGVIGSGGIIAR